MARTNAALRARARRLRLEGEIPSRIAALLHTSRDEILVWTEIKCPRCGIDMRDEAPLCGFCLEETAKQPA